MDWLSALRGGFRFLLEAGSSRNRWLHTPPLTPPLEGEGELPRAIQLQAGPEWI